MDPLRSVPFKVWGFGLGLHDDYDPYRLGFWVLGLGLHEHYDPYQALTTRMLSMRHVLLAGSATQGLELAGFSAEWSSDAHLVTAGASTLPYTCSHLLGSQPLHVKPWTLM